MDQRSTVSRYTRSLPIQGGTPPPSTVRSTSLVGITVHSTAVLGPRPGSGYCRELDSHLSAVSFLGGVDYEVPRSGPRDCSLKLENRFVLPGEEVATSVTLVEAGIVRLVHEVEIEVLAFDLSGKASNFGSLLKLEVALVVTISFGRYRAVKK